MNPRGRAQTRTKRKDTMTTISLGQIVIDSGNAGELATFYSRLLDRPLVDDANQFFAVVPPSS